MGTEAFGSRYRAPLGKVDNFAGEAIGYRAGRRLGQVDIVASYVPYGVYGYFIGGTADGTADVVTTDRLTFSSSTTAAYTTGDLPTAKQGGLNGISDKSTAGYTVGGYTGAVIVSSHKLTYSTGANAANTSSNASQARFSGANFSDSGTYGYVLGGYTGAGVVTGDRLTFSSSTTAAYTGSNLSYARYWVAALSDSYYYGYSLGGLGAARVATTDRTTFSTSATAANTASNLSVVRNGQGATGSGLYGYIMGGFTSNSVVVATTDKLTFSTSVTAAQTSSNGSAIIAFVSAISDGVTYGYFNGGRTDVANTGLLARSDRITYSTETFAANTASNLSGNREFAWGVSDFSLY